jgi:hypothetical protein
LFEYQASILWLCQVWWAGREIGNTLKSLTPYKLRVTQHEQGPKILSSAGKSEKIVWFEGGNNLGHRDDQFLLQRRRIGERELTSSNTSRGRSKMRFDFPTLPPIFFA